MDKELLRVVIILIGVLVIIGMLVWHFFKSLRERRDSDVYDEDAFESVNDEFEIGDEDQFNMLPFDDDEDDPLMSSRKTKAATKSQASVRPTPVSDYQVPALIEFSIVARDEVGFNGEELVQALEKAGLEYGSNRVFERVDRNRLVDFAVASMAKPGLFPETGLASFYCPGIVFFMQPRELDDPLAVFDDFIETIEFLAGELDGEILDNQRQPLNDETVFRFRQILS